MDWPDSKRVCHDERNLQQSQNVQQQHATKKLEQKKKK
jgi:hypothetical protein